MTGSSVARGTGAHRSPGGDARAVNAAAGEADATFPRTVRKVFKAIASPARETDLLRIPWGPRLSVIFDPRSAVGIVGGQLRIYAILESTTVLLSTTPIADATTPIRVLEEAACDTYFVTALLGSALPAGVSQLESFVYAGTYAGGL
jgi:hypothetical protein